MTIRFWNSANHEKPGDVATYMGEWFQFDNDCVEVGYWNGDSQIIAHYDRSKGEFFHLLNGDTAQNFVVSNK